MSRGPDDVHRHGGDPIAERCSGRTSVKDEPGDEAPTRSPIDRGDFADLLHVSRRFADRPSPIPSHIPRLYGIPADGLSAHEIDPCAITGRSGETCVGRQ